MVLSERTPWEQKVIEVFSNHLGHLVETAEAQAEAARHGESPEYADFVPPLLDAMQEASPTEIEAMWVALPGAVVATVRDFLQESAPDETA